MGWNSASWTKANWDASEWWRPIVVPVPTGGNTGYLPSSAIMPQSIHVKQSVRCARLVWRAFSPTVQIHARAKVAMARVKPPRIKAYAPAVSTQQRLKMETARIAIGAYTPQVEALGDDEDLAEILQLVEMN